MWRGLSLLERPRLCASYCFLSTVGNKGVRNRVLMTDSESDTDDGIRNRALTTSDSGALSADQRRKALSPKRVYALGGEGRVGAMLPFASKPRFSPVRHSLKNVAKIQFSRRVGRFPRTPTRFPGGEGAAALQQRGGRVSSATQQSRFLRSTAIASLQPEFQLPALTGSDSSKCSNTHPQTASSSPDRWVPSNTKARRTARRAAGSCRC